MEEDNKQPHEAGEKGELNNEEKGNQTVGGNQTAEGNQPVKDNRTIEGNRTTPETNNQDQPDPANLNIRTNNLNPNDSRFGIGSGVGLTILLHIVVFFLLLVFYSPAISVYLGIGVFQLVYVVPVTIVAQKRGNPKLAAGMWIMAGITFLLNAACWGLVGLPILFH